MRKRVLAVVAAVVAAVVGGVTTATPAAAVTNGQPDSVHTNVGIIVFYNEAGAPTHRCTGTLIDGDTVLTAGHCTYGAASAQVWFDQHVVRTEGGYPFDGGTLGEPVTYPGYTGQIPNTGDVGVIQLTEAPRADTGRYDSLRAQDSGEEIGHA